MSQQQQQDPSLYPPNWNNNQPGWNPNPAYSSPIPPSYPPPPYNCTPQPPSYYPITTDPTPSYTPPPPYNQYPSDIPSFYPNPSQNAPPYSQSYPYSYSESSHKMLILLKVLLKRVQEFILLNLSLILIYNQLKKTVKTKQPIFNNFIKLL